MFNISAEERKILEKRQEDILLHLSEINCMLYEVKYRRSTFRSDDLKFDQTTHQTSMQDGKPFIIKDGMVLVVEFKSDGKHLSLECGDDQDWFKVMWVSLWPNADVIGDLAVYSQFPILRARLPEGTYWLNIAMPGNSGPINYYAKHID